MKRYSATALFVAWMVITSLPSSEAARVGDVSLPDSMKVAGTELHLNGAGTREKYFMDMYVGALYLKQRSSNARKIIEADEPMAIRLQIISSIITSDRMEESTREGFESSTGGKTQPIQKEIDAFISVFRTEIKTGDIYDLIYTPGVGTEVLKNGKSQSVTEGIALKRALFGIWLCDKPVQKDLKEALLGQ